MTARSRARRRRRRHSGEADNLAERMASAAINFDRLVICVHKYYPLSLPVAKTHAAYKKDSHIPSVIRRHYRCLVHLLIDSMASKQIKEDEEIILYRFKSNPNVFDFVSHFIGRTGLTFPVTLCHKIGMHVSNGKYQIQSRPGT